MTVYTHGHHESVLRSHRWRTLENSAAYLLPHLSSDFHVLDLGCGPGTITADLASAVTHVTAVEHTSAALDLARAEMAGRTNVSYVVTDAHALDLPDDSFDVVHAHQVLQHVHDPGISRSSSQAPIDVHRALCPAPPWSARGRPAPPSPPRMAGRLRNSSSRSGQPQPAPASRLAAARPMWTPKTSTSRTPAMIAAGISQVKG